MLIVDLTKLIFGKTPEDDLEPEPEEIVEVDPATDDETQDIEPEPEPVPEAEPKERIKLFDQKAMTAAREEAKKYRLKLRELETKLDAELKDREEKEKAAEREKMDEVQRLQAEREDLLKEKAEAQLMAKQAHEIVTQTVIDTAIMDEANKLGFRNPELAKKFLGDTSFEVDDANVVDRQEITDALSALLETASYLKSEDAPKPKPKTISQPSQTVVKNPVQDDTEDELEKLDKEIRDNLNKSNPGAAASAHYRKYKLMQERSNKPVAVK